MYNKQAIEAKIQKEQREAAKQNQPLVAKEQGEDDYLANKLYHSTKIQTINSIRRRLEEEMKFRTELSSDNSNLIFNQRLEREFNLALASLNLEEDRFEFTHIKSVLVEMGFIRNFVDNEELDQHPKLTLRKEERQLLVLFEKELMLKEYLTRLELFEIILCLCNSYEFYLSSKHQKEIKQVKAEKMNKTKNDFGEKTIISTVLKEAFKEKEDEIKERGKYCCLTNESELIIDRSHSLSIAKDFSLFYVNYREDKSRRKEPSLFVSTPVKRKNDIELADYYRKYLGKMAERYNLNPVDYEGVEDVYELKMAVEDIKNK